MGGIAITEGGGTRQSQIVGGGSGALQSQRVEIGELQSHKVGWGNSAFTEGGDGRTLQSQRVAIEKLCSHRGWG